MFNSSFFFIFAPTKQLTIMRKPQVLQLTDKKTGRIFIREFKTKKECDRFLRNSYTTYSWKTL